MLDPRVLVGRDGELARMRRALERVRGVTGQAIVVEGPPGIGKTVLTRMLTEHAVGQGFEVLWGAARELEQDRPFAPFVDALALDHHKGDGDRAGLGALLRGGSEAALDRAQWRWRVIDGILDALERAPEQPRVLLVVEDVHWADPDSAVALGRLTRALDEIPVALVVTTRPDPPPETVDGALRALIDAGSLHIRLEALDAAAVAELATRLLGAPPTAALAAVLRRAGGNPLYVVELVEALRDEGAITVRGDGADVVSEGLPPSLRLTIIRRLGYLPTGTVAALQHAAVLGESCRFERLADVLSVRPAEVAAVLDPAYRSGLLEPAAGVVAFRHALIRDALYEDLPVARRVALHTDAARVLASAGAPPAEFAAHLARGLAAGDVDAAARLADAAAALVDSAPAAAADHAGAALDALPAGHPARLAARTVLAQAAARTGRPDEAEALAHELADEGLDERTRLVLWNTVTVARQMRGESAPDALADYERLVRDADLTATERATHLALIAFSHPWYDPHKTTALAEEALAEADDDLTRALSVAARGRAALIVGDVAGAYALTERAVEIVRTGGLDVSWVGIESMGLFAFVRSIDPEEAPRARTALEVALRGSAAAGLLYAVPRLHIEMARTACFQGNYDDAVLHAETALRYMDETGYRSLEEVPHLTLCRVAFNRGQEAEARRHLARVQAMPSPVRESPYAQAAWLLAHRDARGAWNVARPAVEELTANEGFISFIWTLPYVEAAVEVGARAEAQAWLAVLERRVALTGGAAPVAGVAANARAVLLRTPEAAREAIAASRRSAVDPFRFDAFRIAGAVLAEHGLRDEAIKALKEGRALADVAGATLLVARYDAALRDLGVRRGAVGGGTRPDTGWDALTDAERRVVELVAQGLSYREVGERLFVSRRTVETHVASVFRKLGIRSRNELTRVYLALEPA